MHTTTKTITTVTLDELRDALRPHLAACGLDADRMIFPMQELKHLEVLRSTISTHRLMAPW